MMNPEPERGERMGARMKTLGEIHSRLEKLKQKRIKLDALGWDDIGQEVVGAATVAVITYTISTDQYILKYLNETVLVGTFAVAGAITINMVG